MVNDSEVLVYERGICQNLHFDHRWYIFPSLKIGVCDPVSERHASGKQKSRPTPSFAQKIGNEYINQSVMFVFPLHVCIVFLLSFFVGAV